MPFDFNSLLRRAESDTLDEAIWYLERGLRRVRGGYTWLAYTRPRIWGSGRLYCLYGALIVGDHGEDERLRWSAGRELAESYLVDRLGMSLFVAGTWPIVGRIRALRAYREALSDALRDRTAARVTVVGQKEMADAV